MLDNRPMSISLLGSVKYIVPAGLAAAAIGAYPTWLLAGNEGLRAKAVAGLIVMGVMLVSAAAIVRAARGGAVRAVYAFLISGLARLLGSVALAAGAWAVLSLSPMSLVIWVGIFYLAMLSAEGVWLAQAMRSHGPTSPH